MQDLSFYKLFTFSYIILKININLMKLRVEAKFYQCLKYDFGL
jgi:hypothetical protein